MKAMDIIKELKIAEDTAALLCNGHIASIILLMRDDKMMETSSELMQFTLKASVQVSDGTRFLFSLKYSAKVLTIKTRR